MFNTEVQQHFVDTYIGYLDAEEEGGAGQPSRVLAPREPEARGPVGEGAEAHVQPVLDEDVDGVLRPHCSGFQECEAALHEEDDNSENCQEEMVNIGPLVMMMVTVIFTTVNIRSIARL